MILNKINLYLFIQIVKYFFLVLFIFLSIAWILQITRLFTISNLMDIDTFDIVILSIYLIPNLITVIAPFILIFGLLLCFVKLNKDNELIAIQTLGLGIKPFKDTLIFFSLVIIIIFSALNFYLSPKIYEKYKNEEYNLRNTIDFNNMVFSNFLNLNKTTILDFKKINNEYQDILISFNDEKENIVFAKKGNIFSKNNQYNFQLINGFKISIDEDKQIEKLEFLNYLLKVDNKDIIKNDIIDKNTFTIFDDLESKNYLNLVFKLLDVFLIVYIIFFFYLNNLKKLNLKNKNNLLFSLQCISILIINQILKNSNTNILSYTSAIFTLVIFSFLISKITKKYE